MYKAAENLLNNDTKAQQVLVLRAGNIIYTFADHDIQSGNVKEELQMEQTLRKNNSTEITELKEYIVQMLFVAQNDLKEGKYEDAYEIVDMLHIFPHIIIANDRKKTEEYWRIYAFTVLKKRKPEINLRPPGRKASDKKEYGVIFHK